MRDPIPCTTEMPDDEANMTHSSSLLSLLLITFLAAAVPLLSARLSRFRVPVVVGEILAGMIIGKSGFNLVNPGEILAFISEFGFVILMFISGLEINFSSLSFSDLRTRGWTFWKAPILLASVSFLLTFAGAFTISVGLERIGFTGHPVIMGLILSTTSLGIVVPVLKERGVIGDLYGQVIVLTALLADFVTLVLLSLAIGMETNGVYLQLTFFLILGVAFALVLKLGFKFKNLPGVKGLVKSLTSATVQIRTRFSIALMVAWVALARVLGAEVILGAFLAGVIMSVLVDHDKETLKDKLDTLGFGFFIPIFFITIGSEFNLWAFLRSSEAYLLLPVLVGAAFVVKIVPACFFWVAFSFRESIAAGFLLSSRLSLIIAASTLAFKLGIVTEAVNASVLVLAMITCTVSPILFNRIAPSAAKRERAGFIVVGLNHNTALLVERLLKEGEEVSVVRASRKASFDSYCKGATVVSADSADREILARLGADRKAALVSVLNNVEEDMMICRLAKEKFGIPVIVSQSDDVEMIEKMKSAGVRVVRPSLATSVALEGALRFPAMFDMISQQTDRTEIGEATILDSQFVGCAVRSLRFPGNVLIMGIRRDGDFIVPHGDTNLSVGDVLMIVGSRDSIREMQRMLHGR
ncbi:MAG: hypothetical protein E4H15_02925 [Syntrophobacterales bacterium]|nr:MAG: hypothetical protein E4H15_02925 [Syntrophobacterales bacterium]